MFVAQDRATAAERANIHPMTRATAPIHTCTLHPAVGLGLWLKLPLLAAYAGLVAWWNREDWHRLPPAWQALRRKLRLS